MVKIGWDITHQEFTVTDHYYFSKLLTAIQAKGIVDEITDWDKLGNYDIIVFNYPEIGFNPKEVEDVNKWLNQGKRVIIAGYYKNEDFIADRINSLIEHFGIKLLGDEVHDLSHNIDGDKLLLVTSIVSLSDGNVRSVFLPCSASVEWQGIAEPLVASENTSWSTLNGRGSHPLIVKKNIGKGELIVCGTCVFWDNFAIVRENNWGLTRYLLNLL